MKDTPCPSCGKGYLQKADNIVSEIGGYVFVEKGERCSSCGAEFPLEEECQRTIATARVLGVWPEPLKLYRKLTSVGRGLILRIPADLQRQMKLEPGTEVTISKVGNRIVVEPTSG